MKIISNFKDYYDFQAHIYGGGDPKICYIRNHKHIDVPDLDIREWEHKCVSVDILRDVYMLWYDSRKAFIPEVRGIVVGDRIFGQIKDSDKSEYRMLREEDIKKKYSDNWQPKNKRKLTDFINNVDGTLIDLCKHINIPVFMFNVYRNTIIIDKNCPNLGKLGIAGYIPAEQMYQGLSALICSKMKDSPDTMPIVNISDRTKIECHGFDYKTSFRGK